MWASSGSRGVCATPDPVSASGKRTRNEAIATATGDSSSVEMMIGMPKRLDSGADTAANPPPTSMAATMANGTATTPGRPSSAATI